MLDRKVFSATQSGYTLLADLFDSGLTEDLAPTLRRMTMFRSLVPADFNTDAAGADHYDLFGLAVQPFASLFLDTDRKLGGEAVTYLHARYRAERFEHVRKHTPDHVVNELRFLAVLTQKAIAEEGGDGGEALRVFLDEHALWWLPNLCMAIRSHGNALYSAAGHMLIQLLLSQRRALAQGSTVIEDPEIPDPEELNEESSPREIAAFLATPAWSGFFFGKRDIEKLGSQLELPRGFGDRRNMSVELLRSAIRFEKTAEYVAGVDSIMVRWSSFFAKIVERDISGSAYPAKFWQERLKKSRSVLRVVAGF